MDKIKNLSLKKSFFLIVTVAAIIVICLSTVSVRICTKIHDQILLSHAYIIEPIEINPIENKTFEFRGGANDAPEYTDTELLICRITEALMVMLPVLFSFLGIGCSGSLFYRWKLKEPLLALDQGISHVAENDLDFVIDYQKPDELGKLCNAFETMRQELMKNNRHMWQMVDERKKINASISHDLRTPITVIKGYSEYLERNLGKGVLTDDETREIVGYIYQAANRLESYSDSVHDIQALEDIVLEYEEITFIEFMQEMKSQLTLISEQNGLQIDVITQLPEKTVHIAPVAVFRIVENIVSNALRYCEKHIIVEFSFFEPYLIINVTDDGKGFSDRDKMEALNFFYKGKKEKEHFGIGLTICKILCEKHKGSIYLDNAPEGGAKVTVKIKTDEIA